VVAATVPGQVSFDNAVTAWEQGSYGWAAAHGTAMLLEQAMFAVSLGATRAVAPVAQCTTVASRSGTAAKSGAEILEREGNVVIASFPVVKGEARVMAEMIRDGDRLILRGAHIEGNGTLKEALSAAKAFGREQGVKEVVIEGGARTTGAVPGHVPRPITIGTGL